MAVSIALSSSASKSSKGSNPSKDSSKAANAVFLGVKTLKRPSPLNVPIRSVPSELSAVDKADTKEESATSAIAVSTMFFSDRDLVVSLLLSQNHGTKTIAKSANMLLMDTTFFTMCV
ncbi:MAG: hypothetical protein ACJAWH_001143 [Maribacter sp.]|jgi:hypothetical protein